MTNPTGQDVAQAGDGQTLTQPTAAQYINQPAEGTQTLTQPGQCIQQSAAGQDVTQAGQDIPQGVPAGSCGAASTAGTTPATTTPATTATTTTPTTTSTTTTPATTGPPSSSGPGPSHYGTTAKPVLATSTTKLAFTGFDVWKLLLVGGLLVGAGAGTWRMARKVGPTTINR